MKGKLSPQYIRPFEIFHRMGKVAYELALPTNLSGVHPVFHVSILQKYILDESHMFDVEEVELNSNLSFEEVSVQIIDCQIKKL